jgi:hypothetical protein
MPKIEFSAANKVQKKNYDYPKLKLGKDERARIVLLEDPIVEYVHTLRMPRVENGVAEKEIVKDWKQNDVEVIATDFVSNPLCKGRMDVLASSGLDPKNCPACAHAKAFPDQADAPKRRYAMHVIRYRTKAGSFEVASPFAVETLVWSFSDTIFNKIADFKEEWDNLEEHDLVLGPCTAPKFQKFDINISNKAEHLSSAERKALTRETFEQNQIEDLAIACGSDKRTEWLEADIDKVKDKWAEIRTGKKSDDTDLDTDLNGLLGSNETKVGTSGVAQSDWTPDADTSASGESADDILSGLDDKEEEKPKAAAKKAPAKKPAADIDDLLGDLNL